MTGRLSEGKLAELSALIADRMGLYIPKKRWCDLERMVYSIARERRFEDAESCMRWLLSLPFSKEHTEIVAAHLTVGETYFFRESASFEVLEKHVLPKLIKSRRKIRKHLRIWSAGCCTGEEPYSVAILLTKMIPDLEDWDITILATDINGRYLEKAAAGVFTRWSFRDPSLKIREKYFNQTGDNCFEILPKIRNMVTFSYLNLASDNYPSDVNLTSSMDIILCRNVLMYFALGRVKRVVRQLYHCLVDGGWLFVAPTDASYLAFSSFKAIRFPGVILHRKVGRADQPEAVPRARVKRPVEPILPPAQTSSGTVVHDGPAAPAFERDTEPKLQPLMLEDAIAEESNPDLSLYMEASVLYEKGKYAEAKEKSKEALLRNQDDAGAMALLGRICANQGRLVEALNWCEEAIRADRLNPGYRYLYATIMQEHGQDGSAILSLRKALYLDRDFVMAHVALGNLMRLRSSHRESQRHFADALSLLSSYRPDDLVPESEGMTAQSLAEFIRSVTSREASK